MEIDLFDTKKFIETNNLKEVTNPAITSKGFIPTSDGLLSNEIFGISIADRQTTYAYIDLHAYFLHPFVYKTLKRLNRNFESVVNCTKKFRIENGELVPDEENGDTGLTFLYSNWDKLQFNKNDSNMRNERIGILSNYKKNELFTRYWIVIPAYYRDINREVADKGKPKHNELNDKYSKLIRLAQMVDGGTTFDFVLGSTYAKVQEQLLVIYDFFKGKLEKKTGMIRRSLMGKSVDYASRLVITAPVYDANSPDELTVDFKHTGVPLAHCLSLFTPFIIAWVKNYFRQLGEKSGSKIPIRTTGKDGKEEMGFVELDSPELYFTEEVIKKEIDNFIKAPGDRFKVVHIPVKHPKKFLPFTLTLRDYKPGAPMSESNISNRYMTWCDILYQAAYDVTQDKHIYVTRYPYLDYMSMFASRIRVMSTKKTMAVYVNEDTVYNNYPVINPDLDSDRVAVSFIDTLSMSNTYLKGLGGDYDGDQISVRAVFTQEANEEADRIMLSKANLLNASGKAVRESSNEAVQTLYALTKFE